MIVELLGGNIIICIAAKSNEQLMIDNDWLQVYDYGQAVYEFNMKSLYNM